MKENGEKLVGQCEISHPVRLQKKTWPSTTNGSASPEPLSPLSPVEDDGMVFGFSQRQNVAFEPQENDSHVPLPARISSEE